MHDATWLISLATIGAGRPPISCWHWSMMLVGGVAAYTVVWDLGDVGIGLMTIFNMIALYPLSGEALTALQEYEKKKHLK